MTARGTPPWEDSRIAAALRRAGECRATLVATVLALAVGHLTPAQGARADSQGPARSYAPGRILVQARPGLPDARFRKLLGEEGAQPQRKLDRLDVYLVAVPPDAEEAIARKLARHPHVKFAEVDAAIPASEVIPNDPHYPRAWHLPRIQAPAAWETSRADGVVVAVLDTGVESSHPDLQGRLAAGWNVVSSNPDTADVNGHGTAVAGTVAAASNNGLGVASVAWNAVVMPVRITNSPDSSAYASDIAKGLTWAADHGAQVANVSYEVSGSSVVTSAAQYMRSKGGVVVVSAGNSGTDLGYAANPYVVSVSATEATDALATWSSFGSYVDLAAPGKDIVTTWRGGGYGLAWGTSFSSPVTAATVALIRGANPSLQPPDIEAVLLGSVDDLGATGWDPQYGHGRVNARKAVELALQSTPADRAPPSVRIASPAASATVEGIVAVSVTATDDMGVAHVELYVNGAPLGTDTVAPYGFSWDSSTTPPGSTVSLTARAYDAAGNVGTSAAVSVKVGGPADTVPPQVRITSPASSATVSGSVSVSASGSDNTKLASVSLYVDGRLLCSGVPTVACVWNTRKVAAGAHVVSATARDAAGNQASASIPVTLASVTTATRPPNKEAYR